ncbi:unnamed protein product [Caenorhabditis bovis]|uniref:Uncharacterized protein n=1 Tax=Caenorhabditis bovis TaxID=2654633 RepID=A0A8S1FB48_9PELO|nr:unnamed protein product [Caenorhabditis bovis]
MQKNLVDLFAELVDNRNLAEMFQNPGQLRTFFVDHFIPAVDSTGTPIPDDELPRQNSSPNVPLNGNLPFVTVNNDFPNSFFQLLNQQQPSPLQNSPSFNALPQYFPHPAQFPANFYSHFAFPMYYKM